MPRPPATLIFEVILASQNRPLYNIGVTRNNTWNSTRSVRIHEHTEEESRERKQRNRLRTFVAVYDRIDEQVDVIFNIVLIGVAKAAEREF